jgi:hypothetical protein
MRVSRISVVTWATVPAPAAGVFGPPLIIMPAPPIMNATAATVITATCQLFHVERPGDGGVARVEGGVGVEGGVDGGIHSFDDMSGGDFFIGLPWRWNNNWRAARRVPFYAIVTTSLLSRRSPIRRWTLRPCVPKRPDRSEIRMTDSLLVVWPKPSGKERRIWSIRRGVQHAVPVRAGEKWKSVRFDAPVEDMSHVPAAHCECIGEELAMTLPGHRFRAHEGRTRGSQARLEPVHDAFELRRQHEVGVCAEGAHAPASVGRVRTGLAVPAEFLHPNVVDSGSNEGPRQRFTREMRMAARGGPAAHIHQQRDVVPSQHFQEGLERPRGVANGMEHARVHARMI